VNRIINNNKFILGNKKIIYHSCPKNGCTSVKTMIMRIFGDSRSNSTHRPWPHDNIRCEPFVPHPSYDIRMCVTRDPVKRFVSAYINRVLHHKQVPYVEFDDFVENFYYYFNNYGAINWHLSQQIRFIGSDPSYYTHIYDVSEMPKISDLLSKMSSKNIVPEHSQSSEGYKNRYPQKNRLKR